MFTTGTTMTRVEICQGSAIYQVNWMVKISFGERAIHCSIRKLKRWRSEHKHVMK